MEEHSKIASGFFFLDKPENCSSFDLIRDLRKKTNYKKFGHTGTLDPFASGLVVVCLNKATKLSSLIINSDKEYLVKIKLGSKTDTGDRDGQTVEKKEIPAISSQLMKKAVNNVLKLKTQVPPQFSAKKINGKAAYKYARDGRKVDIPEKEIEIKKFQIILCQQDEIVYRTIVSKGTYIRTLSETFAEFLDTVAYTSDLRRLSIGNLTVKEAVKPEIITADNWKDRLRPISSIKWEYPELSLQHQESEEFKNGSPINIKAVSYLMSELDISQNPLGINIPLAIVFSKNESGLDKTCIGVASIKNGVILPKRVL